VPHLLSGLIVVTQIAVLTEGAQEISATLELREQVWKALSRVHKIPRGTPPTVSRDGLIGFVLPACCADLRSGTSAIPDGILGRV
jgi:hypothetical protein